MKNPLFYEESDGRLYFFKNGTYTALSLRGFGGGGRGPRGLQGPAGPSGADAPSYQVTATDDITTSSVTDVVATGMTLTPPAGTYLVWFSGSAKVSPDTGTDFVYVSIYSDGSQVASSEQRNGTGDGTAGYNNAFNCVAKVTVNGLQSIEGRWRVGDALDTGTMHQRNLTILKVA